MSNEEMKEAQESFAKGGVMQQHKKKVAAVGILAAIGIALLEAWPTVCPMIPYVNTMCAVTNVGANLAKEKLKEVKEKADKEAEEGQGGGNAE